jgi:pimeloyl-ACP methyl ester carboxylesterase
MGAMVGPTQYQDGYWISEDGLRLHFRDYAGPKTKPPILCLPGLTRNARDFEHLADQLAGDWRVICVELRGRGDSAYSPTGMSYVPLIYLQDLEALLSMLKIKRFIAIGTSLGGLLTMMLSATKPGRVMGAVLNDIGPVIEPGGLDRIRSYVGKSQSWPTWVHAARDLADQQAGIYPNYDLTDWVKLAKRFYRVTKAGRIVPDYDAKIVEPMRNPGEPVDLWPSFESLGTIPLALIRGEKSDILSATTHKDMAKRLPTAKAVTVPGVGHAPTLEEPAAMRAIMAMLKAVPE